MTWEHLVLKHENPGKEIKKLLVYVFLVLQLQTEWGKIQFELTWQELCPNSEEIEAQSWELWALQCWHNGAKPSVCLVLITFQ